MAQAATVSFPFTIKVWANGILGLTQHRIGDNGSQRSIKINIRQATEIEIWVWDAVAKSYYTQSVSMTEQEPHCKPREIVAAQLWRDKFTYKIGENIRYLGFFSGESHLSVTVSRNPDDEKEAAVYPFRVDILKADGVALPVKAAEADGGFRKCKFIKHWQLQATPADLKGMTIRVTNLTNLDQEFEGRQDRPGRGSFPFGEGCEHWLVAARKHLDITKTRMYHDAETIELVDNEEVYGIVIHLPEGAFADDDAARKNAMWADSGEERFRALQATHWSETHVLAKMQAIAEVVAKLNTLIPLSTSRDETFALAEAMNKIKLFAQLVVKDYPAAAARLASASSSMQQ